MLIVFESPNFHSYPHLNVVCDEDNLRVVVPLTIIKTSTTCCATNNNNFQASRKKQRPTSPPCT